MSEFRELVEAEARRIYPDQPAPSSDAYGKLYALLPAYERAAYIAGRTVEIKVRHD